MCRNKIFLLVILISIQVMFFSCKEKKYAYDNIEIFYRDISNSGRSSTKNNSKVSFKTEIIYIFADGNGWQILDERSKENIQDILDEKLMSIKTDDIENYKNNICKVKKIKIDQHNFIVTFSSLAYPGLHYKVNQPLNSDKLKYKQFIIENGDTLNIRENDKDTTGIFYFELFNFKKNEIGTGHIRDITSEEPKNKTLSYEEELKKQATFEFVKVGNLNELKVKFSDKKFVINFVTFVKLNEGDFVQQILVSDDSLKLSFVSTLEDKINYKEYLRLKPNELKKIKELLAQCKISQSKVDLVPKPTEDYVCLNTMVFIKNRGNTLIGGLLDPLSLSEKLTAQKTPEIVRKDYRKYSSTLNGDYELLMANLSDRFEKLDSLNKILYSTMH